MIGLEVERLHVFVIAAQTAVEEADGNHLPVGLAAALAVLDDAGSTLDQGAEFYDGPLT